MSKITSSYTELRITLLIMVVALLPSCCYPANSKSIQPEMELICVSEDGTHFIRSKSGTKFVIWGVNYDHDRSYRLIEDYWNEEWSTVVEDFNEIKALGVRMNGLPALRIPASGTDKCEWLSFSPL